MRDVICLGDPTSHGDQLSPAPDVRVDTALSDGSAAQGRSDADGKTVTLLRDAMHLAQVTVSRNEDPQG